MAKRGGFTMFPMWNYPSASDEEKDKVFIFGSYGKEIYKLDHTVGSIEIAVENGQEK